MRGPWLALCLSIGVFLMVATRQARADWPAAPRCKVPPVQDAGKKLALVIANVDYDLAKEGALPSTLRKLPNAGNDAVAVTQELSNLGFSVYLCTNLASTE